MKKYSKKEIGVCRLCGEKRSLTKEHVPPRSIGNDRTAIVYSGLQLLAQTQRIPWDFSGLRYVQHQGGIGYRTLCKKCNNDTGAQYVPAFKDFMDKAAEAIKTADIDGEKISLHLKDIAPLEVIKQLGCMFLSINKPEFFPIGGIMNEFIRDPEKSGLPTDKYLFYCYFFKDGIIRHTGFQDLLMFPDNATAGFLHLSEIVVPPLSFVLQRDIGRYTEVYERISYFSDYKPREKADIVLNLQVLESHMMYTGILAPI